MKLGNTLIPTSMKMNDFHSICMSLAYSVVWMCLIDVICLLITCFTGGESSEESLSSSPADR